MANEKKIIAIGCDHGGIDLKADVKQVIEALGMIVEDLGCHSASSVDYPDFAKAVCESVSGGKSHYGILICGTGIGMSMAANRYSAIRAALCHDEYTARMSRLHNDANVLCLGARVLGGGVTQEIVKTWLKTEFEGGRHQRRIRQFSD